MSFAQPSRRKRPGTAQTSPWHCVEPLEPRRFLSSAHPFVHHDDCRAMHISTASSAVTGSITGQITDTSGLPLANAIVTLQSVSGRYHWHPGATTDANGNYTLSKVRAGNYTILARLRGYQHATTATFTVAAGDNIPPTLQLAAQT